MKRIFTIVLLALMGFQFVHAQSTIKKHGIGVHFAGLDFYGAQTGKYFQSDRLNRTTMKTESKFHWDPAIRATYWYALSKCFDFNAIATISNLQYPLSDKDSIFIAMKNGTLNFKQQFPYAAADARLNFNILPRKKYIISPYISSGISFAMHERKNGFDLPIGLGANMFLGHDIYFNLATDYRMGLSDWNKNHLSHALGLVYWFGGNKKTTSPPQTVAPIVPAKPIIIDTDKDGIPDSQDECPSLAGKKELSGCPDKDNDGIADKKDKCPEVAGLAKYLGCPMTDADLDGFPDEEDRCPNAFSKTNNGCPEIKQDVIEKVKKAAAGVNFATGSAKLLPSSFTNLDNLVTILNEEISLKVDIQGHTDNKGDATKNIALSQARADACKAYIAQKGIDANRIESKGFGDSMPIGDNVTADGRAKNRRTEFVLKN
jgi:OmpA-OmpF porin, OOP family